jgi:DNA-binding transcriptional LysR family regulator
MDKFQEIQTFQAVVDAGSFIKAANSLGISKAAVSRYVADMETRLGVRLLNRTTRRLSLTDEGQVFYNRSKEILRELQEAEEELSSRSTHATGLLRINAPFTFGILQLAPLWGKFRAQNPNVLLDITLADSTVDLVEEGFDLAIRIANLESSTLVSKRLGTTQVVLCASPQYLAQKGIPLHPNDLAHHDIISYSYLATKDEWHFTGPAGPIHIKTKPCIQTNNGDTCLAAALTHQGIILQPSFLVGPYLANGQLQALLPDFPSVVLGIYALYPSRKHLTPKVRVLIDFLAQEFANKGPNW